jgi:hypothetical protein
MESLSIYDLAKIMTNDKNANLALRYAKKLIGTKYVWWQDGDDIVGNTGPFWSTNMKAPDADDVKKDSCACTGLINLMRRKVGLTIPGVLENSKYAGGTYIWFKYLEKNKKLKEFDINKKYPKGTLLLRKYKNKDDQGHVAVIFTEGKNNVLYEKIIHSYSDVSYQNNKNKVGPGVTLTMLGISHFSTNEPKGYYSHICLPKDWLKN